MGQRRRRHRLQDSGDDPTTVSSETRNGNEPWDEGVDNTPCGFGDVSLDETPDGMAVQLRQAWRETGTTDSPCDGSFAADGTVTDGTMFEASLDQCLHILGTQHFASISPSTSMMQRPQRSRRQRWAIAAEFACLLTLSLLWLPCVTRSIGTLALSPTSAGHSLAASGQQFRPIEDLRVGDRVLADNPDSSQAPAPSDMQVEPRDWRHLVLETEWRWQDGTLDAVHIETLRSSEWIEAHHVAIGEEVAIPLDLVETGLPEDLRACLVENKPCPPIGPGPGRVVLTTANHLHNNVLELRVRDTKNHEEKLHPTCFHKFYSETRLDWILAQDLQAGEILAGRCGPITVVGVSRIPGVYRVYNMTVEGEHVYHVGHVATTAHNSSAAPRHLREVELSRLSPSPCRDVADPVKLERMGPFDWLKYTPIIVEQDGSRLTSFC